MVRLTIIVLLAGWLSAEATAARDPALAGWFSAPLSIVADDKKHEFVVYLALNDHQRRRGLMFVRELPENYGMLFLYGSPRPISMWMKNTFIPLDMLFIAADGTIDSIIADTEPHSLESLRSEGDVLAVLELNAGTAARLGIQPGDRVRHRAFRQTAD